MSKPIPHLDQAVVPVTRIADYLLSQNHPIGRAKAEFFMGSGFAQENPQAMIDAIITHAKTNGAYGKPSPYGLKYIVKGFMDTPARGPVMVCSIWMIETGGTAPAFVTAYPIKRDKA
ncbi:hypothetical protein HFU84_10835 [Acidithiobacillus sp. CV18-2]|nr:hypothetical protein [Acidithiobacillus sp. CV18-3]MBU2756911.1 hypothetical protein [Acidithiobacillus sp. BN09-2]MBU2777991.1 hypothetical protein [Acidithiobacillus sp. CV18-2]MBU2799622.1 hypothetical protein [Acidithiobacillus sp. VAN18-4]